MIHTEKLLMQMTEAELVKRGFKGSFHAQSHYLGYEGRSGYPSDFDATYCYGLGNVAGALIQNKVSSHRRRAPTAQVALKLDRC